MTEEDGRRERTSGYLKAAAEQNCLAKYLRAGKILIYLPSAQVPPLKLYLTGHCTDEVRFFFEEVRNHTLTARNWYERIRVPNTKSGAVNATKGCQKGGRGLSL